MLVACWIDDGFIGHDENLDAEECIRAAPAKRPHKIRRVYSTQRTAGCDSDHSEVETAGRCQRSAVSFQQRQGASVFSP